LKTFSQNLAFFGLFDTQAQYFLAAVGTDAKSQIHRLVLDSAFVPNFQAQCAEINDRVHRFERPLLPLRDLFEYLVGNG